MKTHVVCFILLAVKQRRKKCKRPVRVRRARKREDHSGHFMS